MRFSTALRDSLPLEGSEHTSTACPALKCRVFIAPAPFSVPLLCVITAPNHPVPHLPAQMEQAKLLQTPNWAVKEQNRAGDEVSAGNSDNLCHCLTISGSAQARYCYWAISGISRETPPVFDTPSANQCFLMPA